MKLLHLFTASYAYSVSSGFLDLSFYNFKSYTSLLIDFFQVMTSSLIGGPFEQISIHVTLIIMH